MKIINVIPFKKDGLKGDLTYFTNLDVAIGDVVSVPFRSKIISALVTSKEELKDAKTNIKKIGFNLRKVIENKGDSVFLKQFFDTIFDTSKYFVQNRNQMITSLIPRIFIEEYDKLSKFSNKSIAEDEKFKSHSLSAEKLLLQCPLEERISIYKTLIRESFARSKSVFFVLPTQLDIEKFYVHLSKGIEKFTFSLHSGISSKKNILSYEKIMSGFHPVLIIATAPFLSIPKRNIGTIILEHENSSAYKTISRPHFDLRTFVEIYASKIYAKYIVADEILRFETIGRKDMDNFNTIYPLSYRINFPGKIQIINPRPKSEVLSEKKVLKFEVFSEQSIQEIENVLLQEKNVFIFSLRKGLATMTICHDCGETVNCIKCKALLVLYLSHNNKKRMFVCNKCEEEKHGDIACNACESWNLVSLGVGTDTVFEALKNMFPKTKIYQLDKEAVKNATEAKKIITEYEENQGSILVGTEMTFFYLKNKIPLSIIASFDSLWSIPNFKMSEKIIRILLSILKFTEKLLIVQTKNENDEAIKAIVSENLLSFVRVELDDRKKMDYPPFKRFIKIIHIGDKEQTMKARRLLEEIFNEYSPEIFTGFVSKLNEKYVTNALIKMELKKWALPELFPGSYIHEELYGKLSSLPHPFEVFVDPEDLL